MIPTHEAINTVWKGESAKVVATLARIVRDLGIAEELAQDALVAALEEWPRSGVPDRPGAWLMTTAKNRALNTIRHARVADRTHEAVAHEIETLAGEPALARYHLLPSARADLLEQLGRHDEARAEFERAAGLAENARQRERLRARANRLI